MSISALLSAFVARYNRLAGCPALVGDPDYDPTVVPPAEGDPGYVAPLEVLIGEEHIAENAVPPRLVWVPTRDRISMPARIGTLPVSLADREAGIECGVWGEDLDAAEEMLHRLVFAIREVMLSGRYPAGAGASDTWFARGYTMRLAAEVEWVTKGQMSALGVIGILSFQVRLPIQDEAPTYAVPPLTLTQIPDLDPNGNAPDVPTELRLLGGNLQTADAGTELSDQLSVVASDRDGRPAVGVPVTFTAATSGALVGVGGVWAAALEVLTSSLGVAAVDAKLASDAGPNAFTASLAVSSLGSPQIFTATGSSPEP